jgi:hypothetical protein
MSSRPSTTPREVLVISIGLAAGGLYLVLVGVGLLPVPGGPRNLHGPLWIVLLIGIVLVLAGVSALLQVVGRANAGGELPADAPQWLRVVQYLLGVAMSASFAVIGSWVAIGGDPRAFSGNVLVFDGATNASIARIAFGIGALITWLATITFAVAGARKLVRGKTG